MAEQPDVTTNDALALIGLAVLTFGVLFVFGIGWAAILDGGILFLAGIGAHVNGRRAAVVEEQADGTEPA